LLLSVSVPVPASVIHSSAFITVCSVRYLRVVEAEVELSCRNKLLEDAPDSAANVACHTPANLQAGSWYIASNTGAVNETAT
jgi:hypothetical protein